MKFMLICYFHTIWEWCNLVKLFCKPNLFSYEQEIILINTEAPLGQQVRKLTDECNLNTLGQFLAVGALTNQAETIELTGPEQLLDKIIKDYNAESNKLFANQNVKIEVRKTNE